MAGLTRRSAALSEPERSPMNAELVPMCLLPGGILAAEEVAAAAVHLEGLSVRCNRYVHVAFCTNEPLVNGPRKIVLRSFPMAGKTGFFG